MVTAPTVGWGSDRTSTGTLTSGRLPEAASSTLSEISNTRSAKCWAVSVFWGRKHRRAGRLFTVPWTSIGGPSQQANARSRRIRAPFPSTGKDPQRLSNGLDRRRSRRLGAVCFLWRYPWGHPRRTLSGTVSPWSPDFPPRSRATAVQPTGLAGVAGAGRGGNPRGARDPWRATIGDGLLRCVAVRMGSPAQIDTACLRPSARTFLRHELLGASRRMT